LKNSTKNVGKTGGWGNGELNWSVRKERKKPYPFWWACIQQEGQQLRKLQQEVCQWRWHEYFQHNYRKERHRISTRNYKGKIRACKYLCMIFTINK
jgi:hypothetical protein